MIIQVTSLCKSFYWQQKKIDILQDVSFSMQEGESAAILGKSGSGKSTLLSLLGGLDSADTGEIIIGGHRLGQLSETQLGQMRSKLMGIVFQQFHLIEALTALENVLLPLQIIGEENALERAIELLEAVGLSERLHHFPLQLSGGEKQRVAIARALAPRPKIILADEPTGSLDQETGAEVVSLLFSLVKKFSVSLVLVTHDDELAKRCDKLYFLQKGILKLQ